MLIRYAVRIEPRWQPCAEYAIELLLDGIGIAGRTAASTAEADLVYSAERPPDLASNALWLAAADTPDWDLAAPPDDDIVRSTYLAASGALEQDGPRDAFGVPLARGGGELEEPVVAVHAERLAAALARTRGAPLERVPRWPEGKMYGVVLSHDVDKPFVRAPWSFYLRRLRRDLAHRDPRAAGRGVLHAAKAAAVTRLAPLPPPADDPNFRFDDWMELERQIGARSCFYVAVTTSADDQGAPHDVTYDFRHPHVAAALQCAAAAGWEIGLHASINARLSTEQVAVERHRLESVVGAGAVTGVRHHYWALEAELPERTLRAHAAAGLAYDSSLGLNDAPGFRRGMAWPFRPFDRELCRPTQILEIPPTFMDGSVFSHRVSADEGRRRIESHLAVVRRHGGAAVLDWHLEQLNPQRLHGAGPVLRDVLVDLAADSDVWWATPAELTAWWATRAGLIEAAAPQA